MPPASLEQHKSVFENIFEYLYPRYEEIGSQQAASVLKKNYEFNLGKYNGSGFSWQRPMGSINIGIDRSLAPDLFDDNRWLVTDRFILNVDAFSYLSNLKEEGVIDISRSTLLAFAGITFKREYRYIHVASSYEDGLTQDFNKLFMSFTKFSTEEILYLDEYDYIVKEDFICTRAGSGAMAPLGSGIDVVAGILVHKKKLSSVSIQALGPEDNPAEGEILRLSVEKVAEKIVNADISFEVDFYNLLRLTILSYEYSYSYLHGTQTFLSFTSEDLENLESNEKLSNTITDLLSLNSVSSSAIADYLVSQEERESENQQSKFRLFFWGAQGQKSSEQIVISKNGIAKTFFKLYYESVKYVDGTLETILNGFSKNFLGGELFLRHKISRIRNIQMEYADIRQIRDGGPVVDSEDKLSLTISNEFQTYKTTGIIYERYKDYAVAFAKKFTTISPEVISSIDQEKLVGPLRLATVARINRDGMIHFNKLSSDNAEEIISVACHLDHDYRWYQFISKARAHKCFDNVRDDYRKYVSYIKKYHEIALFPLKNFLISFNKTSDSKELLKKLFGANNVFFNGSVNGVQANNHGSFVNYFSEGTFDGLGIVDNYRRETSERTPASIAIIE